jgi:hypothetical protein
MGWWRIYQTPNGPESLLASGRKMTISEIDKFGGIWVGFGQTVEEEDSAIYTGQSFVIEPDRIQLVKPASR